MRRFSFLISKYVLFAVLPYFFFVWLLLSVILFVQDASRYSDLLFDTSLPNTLIWQLTIALIPNVIAFTCPIAILVAVIIGISRMQEDSEMVTIRAAGVGNLQIVIPLLLLGILLFVFALVVNLKGVPFASQVVRQVALKAALNKLESPIEPGEFNSEIDDLLIYVKKGNREKGIWEKLFIYQKDKDNKQVRLITSKEGRIDTTDEDTEIVLNNAFVTTFDPNNKEKIISEYVKNFRVVVQTKRGELIDKLSKTKETPEEMGLIELAQYVKTLEGREKTESELLWQRRILLSFSPILFVLLGVALVTKFNRGGRGFGVVLSLVSLVIFYLLTLLGEQLARTGAISVLTAGLLPTLLSILVIIWLFISRRLFIGRTISIVNLFKESSRKEYKEINQRRKTYLQLNSGILDFDLVISLLKYYLLTFGFVLTIYLIFTAFELWKFAGTMDNGISLLLNYLFFLIPFIYIQLSPTALMIATLATYIIKSRQNEIVTWTAAGQSIYRLLLPCFVLMCFIGLLNFVLQETIITKANRLQDSLRSQIRSRNVSLNNKRRLWFAVENKIYTFEKAGASDNKKVSIENLQIFELNSENTKLKSIINLKKGIWDKDKIVFIDKAEKTLLESDGINKFQITDYELKVNTNPFEEEFRKPSHLNINETKKKIIESNSINEERMYSISLQKKYTTLFLPLIIILFTAPFALSIHRKGNVVTIGYAVAIWLLFIGISNTFSQFGQSGYLSPILAVWSPLILFAIIGLYILTKVRT